MKEQDRNITTGSTFLSHYEKLTAALFLPVIFLLTLLHLAGESGASILNIRADVTRPLLLYVTAVFALVPFARLLIGFFQQPVQKFHEVSLNRKILLLGIVTAHLSTFVAYRAGQVRTIDLKDFLFYDMFLVAGYYYMTRCKELFLKGFETICLLIWLSAIYGIAEHFFIDQFPFFYRRQGVERVVSVYFNSIPASSVWLMTFWLPVPFVGRIIQNKRKTWMTALYRAVFVIAIFFTLTKNAWIGLGVSLLVYTMLHLAEWRKKIGTAKLAWITFGVTAGIAAFVLIFRQNAYFGTMAARWDDVQTQGSFLARFQHLQDAVEYLRHADVIHLLLGYGYTTSKAFVRNSAHYYGVGLDCIDNQFMTSVFEYGLIGAICIVVLLRYILNNLKNRDSLLRGVAFGLLAMLFPLFTYDAFSWKIVMLPFLALALTASLTEERQVRWDFVAAGVGTCVGALGIVHFVVPAGVRFLRTVSQVLGHRVGIGERSLEITLWALGGCFLIILFVLLGLFLMDICNRKKKGNRMVRGLFAFGCLVLVLLGVSGYVVMKKAEDRYQQILDKEAEAMETIVTSSTGKVFVDRYPSVYQVRFGGIDESFFSGDKIVRADQTTVITDRKEKATTLFNYGYLFTEISDLHAVYTNDVKVISALQGIGYRLTGYYSASDTKQMTTVASGEGMQTEFSLYPAKYLIELEAQAKGGMLRIIDQNTGILLEEKTITADDDGNQIRFAVRGDASSARNITIQYTQEDSDAVISCCEAPDFDVHYTCDYAGKRLREEYYDLEGRKTLNRDGYFAAVNQYNSARENIRRDYFNIDEEPVLLKGGFASVGYTYHNKLVAETAFYGLDGELIALPSKQAVEKNSYNQDGYLVSRTYLDVNREPVRTTYGYAELRNEYNGRKYVIRESYYDEAGEPLSCPQGYHAIVYEKDEQGNALGTYYQDSNGNMVMSRYGYAGIKRNFNEKKQITREEYLNTNGQSMTISSGYAVEEREYDGLGNIVHRRYLDSEGQPVDNTSRYAQAWYTYDSFGWIDKERYGNTQGEYVANNGGYAEVKYGRDAYGNITRYEYRDENEQLIKNSSGYAVLMREYDWKNQIIRESYADENGNLMAIPAGTVYELRSYDERGNLIRRQYFDEQDCPVTITAGYAEVRYEYNDDRYVIKESYYDKDGKAVIVPGGQSAVGYIRDTSGNAIKTMYYDQNENLITHTSGYAQIERAYNVFQQVIEETYFDQAGEQITFSDGKSVIKRAYDDRKRLIQEQYLDAAGQPVRLSAGYTGFEIVYSAEEGCDYLRYLDENGNVTSLPSGYAQVRRNYDEHNWKIKEEYLDEAGQLIERTEGYAACYWEYDQIGNVEKYGFLKADCSRAMTSGNWSYYVGVYNERKQAVKFLYYDTDEKPVMTSSGYALVEFERDEVGRAVEELYYDDAGKPVERDNGAAKIVRVYQPSGTLLEEKRFRLDGTVIE